MADVAARAGVSHQTVSRVVNEAGLVRESTRARVLAAIDELGYRPNRAARALATNRSGRIGLVAARLELHGPSMLALGVQEAGYRGGYDTTLIGLPEFSADLLQRAVDRLLDEAVEAVVVAVAHREALGLVSRLDVPVPVVTAQGVAPGQAMAAGIDQELGGLVATRHLLDLGHRRVAMLTGPPDWTEAGQRREGWLRAHAERGLEPGPELHGDWSAASGYDAGRSMTRLGDVTAVFAANDFMALGLLRALHERGLDVPRDVAVVGFDDVPEAAYYWPALTTVRQDFARLGEVAVDLAVRALAGEQRPTVPLIPPHLVARASAPFAP